MCASGGCGQITRGGRTVCEGCVGRRWRRNALRRRIAALAAETARNDNEARRECEEAARLETARAAMTREVVRSERSRSVNLLLLTHAAVATRAPGPKNL